MYNYLLSISMKKLYRLARQVLIHHYIPIHWAAAGVMISYLQVILPAADSSLRIEWVDVAKLIEIVRVLKGYFMFPLHSDVTQSLLLFVISCAWTALTFSAAIMALTYKSKSCVCYSCFSFIRHTYLMHTTFLYGITLPGVLLPFLHNGTTTALSDSIPINSGKHIF